MRLVVVLACSLFVATTACEKKKPAPAPAAASAPTTAAAPIAPAKPAPAAAPLPAKVPFVPARFQPLVPSLVFKDAAVAIDWYKKALGATELMRMQTPGGKGIMHAEIRVGGSVLMMGEAMPGMEVAWPQGKQMPTGSLMLYVPDVDAVVAKVVAEGGKLMMAVQDMFWGDRFGHVIDPFGHHWGIATHKEDVSPADMQKRGEAWAKEMMEKHKK